MGRSGEVQVSGDILLETGNRGMGRRYGIRNSQRADRPGGDND